MKSWVLGGSETRTWGRLGLGLGLGALFLAGHASSARADQPGPDTLPIAVLAITPDGEADDQAEAMTKGMRNAVKAMPGWSIGAGDYSLEVLSIEMKCAKPPAPPDPNCESRIADQIKADRYIWGILKKNKGGNVTGELHFWVRGKGTSKVNLNYSANLTEANDEALKKVAGDALQQLTGGPPKGGLHVKAGDIGGQVFVDGQPIGALTGGDGQFPLASGPHKIVVKAPGYVDAEAQVVVKPNANAEVSLTLVPAAQKSNTSSRKIGGFIGIGAGVAFGVVGVVSSLQVNGVKTDQGFQDYAKQFVSSTDVCEAAKNNTLPNPAKGERQVGTAASAPDAASMCSKAATFQVLQFVFYGLAAVAGGTGIYLLATSPSAAPKTGFTFHPSVGANSGRVDLTYRW